MEHPWGIDLGGTKIEGVILDPAALDRPVCRLRVPTESGKGYDHVRAQIAKLAKMISSESGLPLPKRIGMGTPGVIDPHTGKLKNSNTQCLNGQRLQDDLEADLGVKLAMANDANCFALAEATLGAAADSRRSSASFSAPASGADRGRRPGAQRLPWHRGEWGQIVLDPTARFPTTARAARSRR